MISVVCVYNNQSIFANVLLKSLRKQTAVYELIALDNASGRFRSAAEAYNFGGASAKGDYIMFAHQDMWLATSTWLEHAERTLGHLPALGVAGVAGVVNMSERGGTTGGWAKSSVNFLDETTVVELPAVQVPQEVETLDECLLLVPRPVFDKLKFDETTFDGWDCYGTDYCLSANMLGFKAYVIPAPCNHCCARSTLRKWEFKDLLKYQKRLFSKHRHNYETICTWMGEINRRNLLMWSLQMFYGPLYHSLLLSTDTSMRIELAGCETVLDLNCSYRPLVGRSQSSFSLGLDSFEPYLQESKRRALHSEYVLADVRSIPFKPKSFDAVVALEMLDCLTKEEGAALLYRMEELARKRVIVTTGGSSPIYWMNNYPPNRYLKHQSSEGERFPSKSSEFFYANPVQEYDLSWETAELVKFGFRVRGYWGRKKSGKGKSILKCQPAILRLLSAIPDQFVVYYCPKSAKHLVAVKHLDSADQH